MNAVQGWLLHNEERVGGLDALWGIAAWRRLIPRQMTHGVG